MGRGAKPYGAFGRLSVPGQEVEHQRVRDRPRLAPEVPDVFHLDPDLLAYLPLYGLLDGLAGLDEARERAVHPGREAWPAGQEHPLLVLDQHDRRRVQARVERRPAALALPGELFRAGHGLRPAPPAD